MVRHKSIKWKQGGSCVKTGKDTNQNRFQRKTQQIIGPSDLPSSILPHPLHRLTASHCPSPCPYRAFQPFPYLTTSAVHRFATAAFQIIAASSLPPDISCIHLLHAARFSLFVASHCDCVAAPSRLRIVWFVLFGHLVPSPCCRHLG
ncbi:hypothetical protein ACHAWO_007908 [Cyclotella atomus]|uniref:Uncharacterized protein n=1 Tax=Cyclotella atomus TaxID=382360 RepID=A0ABD3NG14_9STRA